MFKDYNANQRMDTVTDERPYKLANKLIAEFLGDLIFVFIGSSQALAQGGILNAAIAHGFAIFILVSSLAHISGGHFNPAVTLSVALCGKMKAVHAVFYMMAQLFGGFCGSLLVRAMTSETQFHAIDGGTTTVGNAFMWYQGLIAEVMMTFLLTQTVVLTAVDTCSNTLAPFAIGSALVIDILAVGTVSGASMNPARSFGPSISCFDVWNRRTS
uniref:Aquaporin-8 n=1 Tax=Ascaris suum TaxID=6253 RepID=F1LBL7_ASCSU